jgi:hypothetical protein
MQRRMFRAPSENLMLTLPTSLAVKVGGVYIARAVISEMAGMQNVDIANFGV